MSRTLVGVGDAKAVKRWSLGLALDVSQRSYWNSKFMGVGNQAETPVQILTDLESDAGDQIAYDLLAELRASPIEGEDILEGREEAQRFYTDTLYIDQARQGVSAGGSMTRKRTIQPLRELAKRQLSNYWARVMDEQLFMYVSGARGVNTNFMFGTSYTGRANNSFVSPDTNHQLYGGDATAFNNIDTTDKFSLTAVDTAKTKADNQGGGASGIPVLQPCKIDGGEHYVCVMHVFQEDDMRQNTSTGQYLDIQKAAASAEGRNNPLFKGSLGMYRNVIMHSHRNVIRFSTAGSGANLAAARALFLGSQAAVMAFGSPGTGMRFKWNEEMDDRGDKLVITSSTIFGVKKCSFTIDGTSQDFGVFAIDTYAATR